MIDETSSTQIKTLEKNCKDFGIKLFGINDPNQGIVHVIGPQLGITLPGSTIVCGDSHTSTQGAFGAFAFGIGTSEVEHTLATQTHKEEKDLLDEMTEISKVSNPDLALLVIDGTIGQQCFSQAEAFNKIVPVGGIVITKLDSSAKGGGALAASAATGAQVMYVGTGERIDDLEQFSHTVLVYPWIGCDACSTCKKGDTNLCETPKSLGVFQDGGYAEKVICL